MQKNIDREPLSIAVGIVTFGPPIVSSIRFLVGQIHSIVQNYGSNKKDCIDLAGHVNEVIGHLQYFESDMQLNEQLEESLQNLESCLQECLLFLQKYLGASFIGHIIRSHHYRRRFEELNKQFVNCKERLLFGLSVHNWKANAPAQRRLTSASLADEQRRQKHLVQSPHKHPATPNNHFMRQSPVKSPHQNRRIHHSNSAANLVPNRMVNHHASNGKHHHANNGKHHH